MANFPITINIHNSQTKNNGLHESQLIENETDNKFTHKYNNSLNKIMNGIRVL